MNNLNLLLRYWMIRPYYKTPKKPIIICKLQNITVSGKQFFRESQRFRKFCYTQKKAA